MEKQTVFVVDSFYEKVIADFHDMRIQLIKDVMSGLFGLRYEEDQQYIALVTIHGEPSEFEHLVYKETELGIIKTDYSFRNPGSYLQFLPAEGLKIGTVLVI